MRIPPRSPRRRKPPRRKRQVCEGLQYLHSPEKQIVHRDLKARGDSLRLEPGTASRRSGAGESLPAQAAPLTLQSAAASPPPPSKQLENLLLANPNDLSSVRIVDFGLAKSLKLNNVHSGARGFKGRLARFSSLLPV